MNMATGLLEAPVEKTASGILEALEHAGTSLLKSRGLVENLGQNKIPLPEIVGGLGLDGARTALGAGAGAGAQQATNRLLRRKLVNNPKLLKALELGSATTLGGAAGLAGALTAPLSKTITNASGGQAARQIAELTAMGAGAELALSPAVRGLLGAPVGATSALGRMFGGGALALGGVVAKDRRLLSQLRNHYAMGGKLPRGVDPRVLGLTTGQNVTQRVKSLGIPEGGVLGASGLGLIAAGNPYLGAGALLAAPLKNKNTSKYIGDTIRELRAGSSKATLEKKTKDTIDGLYKKSSYTIKLAAPVYNTHYCLDAPTIQKQANIGGFFKGIGEFATKAYKGGRNRLGSGLGRTIETFSQGRYAPTMGGYNTRAAIKGRNQINKIVKTQLPKAQNPAAVGETALLQEAGRGASTTGTAPTQLTAPVQNEPTGFLDAFRQGRAQSRYKRRSRIAETEQGYDAFRDLGDGYTAIQQNRQARQAAQRLEQSGGVEAATQRATTPQTQVPTNRAVNFRNNPNQTLEQANITEITNFADHQAANTRLTQLRNQAKSRALTAEEQQLLDVLEGYTTPTRTGDPGLISKNRFSYLQTQGQKAQQGVDDIAAATATQATEQTAINASPLTPPVQAGDRVAATPSKLAPSVESQAVQSAAAEQRELAGGLQGMFQYRPGGNPRGTFTSADQGLEIANIRFADSQLGQDLIAIEGRGGLGKSSTVFQQGDIIQAQTQAAKKAQLHTAAERSTQATNALNAELQQGVIRNNPAASAELQVTLTDLAKQSGEVNAAGVIAEVNTRLAARGGPVTALNPQEVATIEAAFAGQSGKAFRTAQKELDGAMELYNSNLKTGLEAQLNKAETRLSDNLATRVDKMSKETTGPLGFGQARRSAAEIQDLEEVRALVETRARIMRSPKTGGTIADRTQAAEMMRITEEALRSGSAEEIRALKQALATPGAELVSSGSASPFTRLLNTQGRKKAFGLTSEQAAEFSNVVKMEGRGAGDQVKATREIFSAQAARSPNTPQGRELTQVVNEAAGTGPNAGANAEAFLNLGRQEGAGGSAFGKLTSGNKAGYSSEGYTIAELQAMGAAPQIPAGLNTRAEAIFDQYIMRGTGTISENVVAIDRQMDQVRKALRTAKPANQGALQAEFNHLRDARNHVQKFIGEQNTTLKDTFDIAQKAEQGAANLVKKDVRMGNITLLNDAAKVEVPRNMNLDATRSALEAAANSDPAQHSQMVEGVFAQLKRSNPSMADEAIAQRMINDGLISAEQLATMGGAEAFAAGTTQQAGGGAMSGVAALAAAGLGTAALVGRKPGVATQAKERAKQQVRASWGISPMDAPVIRSKLASPIKPIPLKATQSKLPDMLKAPTQSPTTATAESRQSLLMAPVGGM